MAHVSQANRDTIPPMRPNLLVTGFEPFGGDALNPSMTLAQALDGSHLAGHTVRGAVLPCRFDLAPQVLARALAQWQPALVVCLGLAGSRAAVSIERVALNLIDARIADNAGNQPVDLPVLPGAAPAYFSTLPVKALAAALRRAGIPAEVSHSAGTFVCNQVFFALMHQLCLYPGVRGGFVHLPALPQHAAAHPAGVPMDLATQRQAVELILATALERREDLHESAGTVD